MLFSLSVVCFIFVGSISSYSGRVISRGQVIDNDEFSDHRRVLSPIILVSLSGRVISRCQVIDSDEFRSSSFIFPCEVN